VRPEGGLIAKSPIAVKLKRAGQPLHFRAGVSQSTGLPRISRAEEFPEFSVEPTGFDCRMQKSLGI
jgi:hypothetical protein